MLNDTFAKLFEDSVRSLEFTLSFIFSGDTLWFLTDLGDFIIFFAYLILEVATLRLQIIYLQPQTRLHLSILDNWFASLTGDRLEVIVPLTKKVISFFSALHGNGLTLYLILNIIHII